jgi:site-specific DNA recombinase
MKSKSLRCAIYTRKSTEEGLEQDFNSLDAQREACAAYIASQASLGWKLLAKPYDDGGISGGTMDRPALQDLLSDIQAGRVDVVVVYKIDRLTRSLMDFARIVEVFDSHEVSFVSVTQQFNTTSSMGRLTLNVLLSFAQFEREVTAERIRDKFAASKKRGMWMGGPVPIGYRAQNRKLVITPREAELVRRIFNLYLECGSVPALKDRLDDFGIQTPPRQSRSGRTSGGNPFSRGRLYWILSNPVYAGDVRHGSNTWPGQHSAIIERSLWDTVQQRLQEGSQPTPGNKSRQASSLLSGLVHDETGDRLTPTFTVKAGRRHRYYVSNRLLTTGRRRDAATWRLPARQLELAVVDALAALLSDQVRLLDQLASSEDNFEEVIETIDKACQLAGKVRADPGQARSLVRSVIERVTVSPGQLKLLINREKLYNLLDILPPSMDSQASFDIHHPFTLRRRGIEARLVMVAPELNRVRVDQKLISKLAEARHWLDLTTSGSNLSISKLAKQRGADPREVTRILPLAFLAPDIVEAILDGRQPVELTTTRLRRHRPIPLHWQHQRRLLGFPAPR